MKVGRFPALFWGALGLLVIAYSKVSPKTLLFRDCFVRSGSEVVSRVRSSDFPGRGCVGLVDLWKQQGNRRSIPGWWHILYLCETWFQSSCLSVSSSGLSGPPLSSLSFHMTRWYPSEAAWQHMDLSDIWCMWQEWVQLLFVSPIHVVRAGLRLDPMEQKWRRTSWGQICLELSQCCSRNNTITSPKTL